MPYKTIYLCGLTLLFACSIQTGKDTKTLTKNLYNEISFDKLDIPKHWTELTKQDNDYIFLVPCRQFRDLLSIGITNNNNVKEIQCTFETEGRWFKIKSIRQQGDSLTFATLLYDGADTTLISMKYIDKEKNIARWTVSGWSTCTYIPTQDTIKYKRIAQSCDSITKQ
jgi:hypothetical protein